MEWNSNFSQFVEIALFPSQLIDTAALNKFPNSSDSSLSLTTGSTVFPTAAAFSKRPSLASTASGASEASEDLSEGERLRLLSGGPLAKYCKLKHLLQHFGGRTSVAR